MTNDPKLLIAMLFLGPPLYLGAICLILEAAARTESKALVAVAMLMIAPPAAIWLSSVAVQIYAGAYAIALVSFEYRYLIAAAIFALLLWALDARKRALA